ncbi:MAG TPA: nuclear transport factor 2 family protein [Candidatus Acidoferrales bacterium]|nr:nuclear transport factor 2 family protein [Candidatus Acidoferrales bacterium]
MSLTADEEAQIRKAVETIDDEEPAGVLNGDLAAQTRFWDANLTVNAPNNQIVRHADILKRMEQHTGLQYSVFERHREATVIRRDCAVTMGYEIVVPKGNVPDSGKTINRRYTNIYYFEDGGWRLIARQATNISVK